MAKYDFDDGGSSNGGSNSEPLKLEPPCMIRCTLDGVFSSNSEWGQSLGIALNNVEIVDGIFAIDENSGNFKVLSWDKEIAKFSEDTSRDDLGDFAQRTYVGSDYTYEILDARLEADEDVGYGNDPEEFVPATYEVNDEETNDFIFFTGATENGPKSTSKTLAKILAAQGSTVVVDDESQDNWLDQDIALREDLMGREVILAMTVRKAEETGRNFHHPFVLDAETRAPIFADNTASEEETEEEDVDGQEEEEEEDDMPEDLQQFYETCNELSINQEDAVVGLLDDMVDDGDVSEEAVEEYGRDNIIEDLTS